VTGSTADTGPDWFLTIRPKRGLLHVPVDEIVDYRDLIFMFVLRNFVARYKQTVLGPVWLIIQPLLTTGVFTIVFGRIADLSTDGLPHVVFYLSGVTCWTYFASTFMSTANTFRENAPLFGKVYFPRLIVPIATMISNGLAFVVQFALLLIVAGYLHLTGNTGPVFNVGPTILILPVVAVILAATGLGLGLMISATTAKYRDLAYLVGFGTQLLMYATPVIYPLSAVPDRFALMAQANPVAHAVEAFRRSLFGHGQFTVWGIVYAVGCSLVVLGFGVVAFNRVEQRFIDTI
jgi:lipopolysaccharide transport system permease protein